MGVLTDKVVACHAVAHTVNFSDCKIALTDEKLSNIAEGSNELIVVTRKATNNQG